jgi:aquaporin PIP
MIVLSVLTNSLIDVAVTFALFLVRKISLARAVFYMAAQVLGSIFGAALLWGSLSGASWNPNPATPLPGFRQGIDVVPAVGRPPFGLGANQLNPTLSPSNGLLLEIMGTAMLISTVLNTAVDNRSLATNSSLAPIPIGISIWIVHLVLIPWTGCGINPARTFGPAVVASFGGLDTWGDWWWIYYLGPFLGSLIATMITCILWGSSYPPSEEAFKKVDAAGDDKAEPDLDAITI